MTREPTAAGRIDGDAVHVAIGSAAAAMRLFGQRHVAGGHRAVQLLGEIRGVHGRLGARAVLERRAVEGRVTDHARRSRSGSSTSARLPMSCACSGSSVVACAARHRRFRGCRVVHESSVRRRIDAGSYARCPQVYRNGRRTPLNGDAREQGRYGGAPAGGRKLPSGQGRSNDPSRQSLRSQILRKRTRCQWSCRRNGMSPCGR